MIGWATIGYGAALSALLAGALVTLATRSHRVGAQGHRVGAGIGAAVGAAAGPIAWNAILRATHGTSFFADAPVAVLPASWQDTGSGVFAVAATLTVLGLGPLAGLPARRVVPLGLLAGLAAFLVEVYLY
jgi:hypothetical protein